jgi:hypothetical protein
MNKKAGSRYFIGAALAAILSFAAGAGCSDETEEFLTGSNCEDACIRYASCYDPAFNTDLCEERCEEALDQDRITIETTNVCLDCIGENVCAAPTFSCASVCNGVIVIDT